MFIVGWIPLQYYSCCILAYCCQEIVCFINIFLLLLPSRLSIIIRQHGDVWCLDKNIIPMILKSNSTHDCAVDLVQDYTAPECVITTRVYRVHTYTYVSVWVCVYYLYKFTWSWVTVAEDNLVSSNKINLYSTSCGYTRIRILR